MRTRPGRKLYIDRNSKTSNSLRCLHNTNRFLSAEEQKVKKWVPRKVEPLFGDIRWKYWEAEVMLINKKKKKKRHP